MISYLEGKIILKKDKYAIVKSGGLGYKVFLSPKNLLELKEKASLFCFLEVKENALNLYGFLAPEELELFELVEGIRGVGPKAALQISSFGSLEKLKHRILKKDEKIFEGVPGIGRKKAMTIILELTGKIKDLSKKKSKENNVIEDSLIALGFSRQESKEALERIPEEIKSPEEKIKTALRILGKT